jgi:hypothetical protein
METNNIPLLPRGRANIDWSSVDEAHAPITLLVPVSVHRKLREDPEFRKQIVQYANEIKDVEK